MLVLAIDPGRDKIGLALLDDNLEVYLQKIVLSDKFESYLVQIFHKYKIDRVVIGNGTAFHSLEKKILKLTGESIKLTAVDERFTTREAEERYWQEHPRRGWRKLFPFVSWKPQQAVDDYAALVLGERFIKGLENITGEKQ